MNLEGLVKKEDQVVFFVIISSSLLLLFPTFTSKVLVFTPLAVIQLFIGILILKLKNRLIRSILFVAGLFLIVIIYFGLGFICFDQCPVNAKMVFISSTTSLWLFWSFLVIKIITYSKAKIVLLLLGFIFYMYVFSFSVFRAY